MTRTNAQTKLTDFDLMVIRSGGRTQAELQAMVESSSGFDALRKICAFLADTAYRAVVKFNSDANRTADTSHHRLAAKNGCSPDGARIG
jgi:hypothetical protein